MLQGAGSKREAVRSRSLSETKVEACELVHVSLLCLPLAYKLC